MFQVKEVCRGLFRDKAFVLATADASHSRRRLSWDELGAPSLNDEVANVRRGHEFFVALRRNSVKAGQTIDPEQVSTWWAFRKLWRRVQ